MRTQILGMGAVLALIASGCAGADGEVAVGPDAAGEILIEMDEFGFGVDVVNVTAGQTVTFVLLNTGQNEHEFMIGQNLIKTSEGYPNGFEHDFFETIVPVVEPANAGMDMGAMDAGMDMSGDDAAMDMSGDDAAMDMSGDDAAMDMSGDDAEMDMSGDDAEMDMSGDDAEMDMSGDDAEMDMSGDDAEMDMSGDDAEMDMPADDEPVDADGDVHAGFMVQRRAGEVARMTVTIPDDVVGEWEIGCFRGRGAHWDAGMRAVLVVSAA